METSTLKLYLVPVPIGNLSDITLRAIEVLRSVPFIVVEDTRYSLKLLNHFGIKKPLVSYFHPREQEKVPFILKKLSSFGSAALITNSGTPVISDPGFPLVREAIRRGIRIVPLPGPSAIIPAVISSGIRSDRFLFLGFMPKKTGALQNALKGLKNADCPMVFYQSPRRIDQFLQISLQVFGPRIFSIAKEISKKNEKIIRGNLADFRVLLEKETLLGELVVVIDGNPYPETSQSAPSIESREDIYRYFKEIHRIPRNRIKDILQKKK